MKTEEQRLLDELYDIEKRIIKSEEYILDTQNPVKAPKAPVNQPDADAHQKISFIKSGIRILSCGLGIVGLYELGFLGLLLAEIVGIKEELV